jgi:predicted outer membrane repeat protein
LNGVLISGSTARQGGGVYNAGSLEVLGSVFYANQATGDGGAIYTAAGGDVRLVLSLVTGNRAARGGGLYLAKGATYELEWALILGNFAPIGANVFVAA